MINYIGRHDLTDEEYKVLAAFLPAEYSGKAGHPYVCHRKVLNGLLWRLRTGAPWRDIPECYGPWSTIQTRFRRWQKQGLWQKILDALQGRARKLGRINFDFSAFDGSSVRAHKCAAGAEKKKKKKMAGRRLSPEESQQEQALGTSRGGLGTKIHVLCEGEGRPITFVLTPGQRHESTQVEELLDRVAIGGKPGAPRRRFDTVAGDKGYDYPHTRRQVRERGSRALIPHKKCKDGTYPPEAEGFDKAQYRRRNVVERLIGRLKEWRTIATRYEKLAESFRAVLLLGFIMIWIKDLLAYTA